MQSLTRKFTTMLRNFKWKWRSSFLEAVFLALIEQVSFCTAEVDNLGASITIFLLLCALLTVVGIRDADTTTYDAPTLERPIVAFVTHPHQRAGPHI